MRKCNYDFLKLVCSKEAELRIRLWLKFSNFTVEMGLFEGSYEIKKKS